MERNNWKINEKMKLGATHCYTYRLSHPSKEGTVPITMGNRLEGLMNLPKGCSSGGAEPDSKAAAGWPLRSELLVCGASRWAPHHCLPLDHLLVMAAGFSASPWEECVSSWHLILAFKYLHFII